MGPRVYGGIQLGGEIRAISFCREEIQGDLKFIELQICKMKTV